MLIDPARSHDDRAGIFRQGAADVFGQGYQAFKVDPGVRVDTRRRKNLRQGGQTSLCVRFAPACAVTID